MLNYYEIAVENRGLRQINALTYSSESKIETGTVVLVSVRNTPSTGVVLSACAKPKFKTKPVEKILYPNAIPQATLNTIEWMSQYYCTSISRTIGLLFPRGASKSRRAKKSGEPSSDLTEKQTSLTQKQEQALSTLNNEPNGTFILHGATGSGKTRVYLERAKKVLGQGRGVIILVPEIGLTSQMVLQSKTQLKSEFILLHSNQTQSQRHQQWEKVYESTTPLVIGPRSALFCPVKNIGLIVIDEEHEATYKQESAPKYHSLHVAAKLGAEHKAQIILGSATPRIEDVYLAKKRKRTVISMPSSVNKKSTDVVVIDLKTIKDASKRILSPSLISATKSSLANNRQVLLFHNRRGTSSSVLCSDCGETLNCPSCHLPLTHHSDWKKLVCHICNYRTNIIFNCPECRSSDLIYKGVGTKQIAKMLSIIFPAANIARFDSDLSNKDKLANRYEELRTGGIDIVVGTQMIAKGLDLPKLETVGVINADSSLYLPDYSAGERTFQLINQVIGRVGRHIPGKVVVQTYSPDHIAIKSALNKDYQAFFNHEIAQREQLLYPPFAYLLKISGKFKSQAEAQAKLQKLADDIRKKLRGSVQILGPTPAYHERSQDTFRWQLVIKSKRRKLLQAIIAELGNDLAYELDPINLL